MPPQDANPTPSFGGFGLSERTMLGWLRAYERMLLLSTPSGRPTRDVRQSGELELRLLEVLRQPIEDKVVTISRVKGTVTFPANFIMVAVMNPRARGSYCAWQMRRSVPGFKPR